MKLTHFILSHSAWLLLHRSNIQIWDFVHFSVSNQFWYLCHCRAWSYQQKISRIRIWFLIFWKIWGRYLWSKPDDRINKNQMTETIYCKYFFRSCSFVNLQRQKLTIEHDRKIYLQYIISVIRLLFSLMYLPQIFQKIKNLIREGRPPRAQLWEGHKNQPERLLNLSIISNENDLWQYYKWVHQPQMLCILTSFQLLQTP